MHSNDSREDTASKRAAVLGDRLLMGSMGTSAPDDLSAFHHIRSRTMGHVKHKKRAILNWTTRKLPNVLAEREISVGQINKIFASEWISDHQVVVGTKCNSVSKNSSFMTWSHFATTSCIKSLNTCKWMQVKARQMFDILTI